MARGSTTLSIMTREAAHHLHGTRVPMAPRLSMQWIFGEQTVLAGQTTGLAKTTSQERLRKILKLSPLRMIKILNKNVPWMTKMSSLPWQLSIVLFFWVPFVYWLLSCIVTLVKFCVSDHVQSIFWLDWQIDRQLISQKIKLPMESEKYSIDNFWVHWLTKQAVRCTSSIYH